MEPERSRIRLFCCVLAGATMDRDGGCKKIPATLTATRPTAFTGRTWVRWTQRMKAEFLDHLAATCNVKESAAVIGVDPVSVYGLRRRDKAFMAEWATALASGYEMLETQLVGHVLAGGADGALTNGDVATTGPIDVALALKLLTAHRDSLAGRGRHTGRPRDGATIAETDAALLKKLKIVTASQKLLA